MLRTLAAFGLVAVGHVIFAAVVLALVVAAMIASEGAENRLLLPLVWGAYFPALTALKLGADLEGASPAGLAFAFVANSLCWTSLVYPVCACLWRWVLARKRRTAFARRRTRERRTAFAHRRKEEAAWWAAFFRALSSEAQRQAEPAAPDWPA